MILQRYRSNIIGYDIRHGQSSYTPIWLAALTGGGVAFYIISAFGHFELEFVGCVRSYPITCVESYFTASPLTSTPTLVLFSILFLPVVGLAQTKLTDVDPETPEDKSTASQVESHVTSSSSKIYGYVRQSQTDEDKSSSIESQRQGARYAAEEEGHSSVEFFEDKDESGFSFDRDGIQKLLNALERESRPVVLDRIDRLGRDTLETIYVTGRIHYNYEVDIITEKHGVYELEKIDEQLDLVLNAIIAGKSVKNRIRAAWNSIRLRFSDDRRWSTWFNKIPIGYQSDGNEWIEPAPHAEEVIPAIINDLLASNKYTQTVDRLKQAGKNETLPQLDNRDSPGKITLADLDANQIQRAFDGSDYDLTDLQWQQLRRLLTNHLLTGEVRYPRSTEYEQQTVLETPELQIVDQELFDEVNEYIDSQSKKYSTDTSENVDMETLADLGMLLLSIDKIENIGPICPQCNRGMVQNGADHENPLDDGRKAHYWVCPKYTDEGKEADCQRKVPYNAEWEAIQNDLEDSYTEFSDIILLKVCPPEY
jgi:hypothetical protein